MAEQSVTLQPGESKVISFEAVPHEAKTYYVSVNGLSGSFIAKVEAPPPGTANLYGIVSSNGQPLSGVRVRIPSPLLEYQDYTDDNGYYEILNLVLETYQVEFYLLGYEKVIKVVTLTEGNNLLVVNMTAAVGPILAHLYGYITNHYTGKTIEGVTIRLVGQPTWVTGEDGFYEFFNIVPGDVLQPMTLTKDGYASQTLPLYISRAGDIRHDIVMVPTTYYSCEICVVDWDVAPGEGGELIPIPVFWRTWDYDEYIAHMQSVHPGKPISPP